MRRLLVAVTIALALVGSAAPLVTATPPDKKEREWKTGKVLDTSSQDFTTYGGSNTQGQVNNDGTYSSTTTRASWNHAYYKFAIRGDDMIYIVSHILSWRWSKEVQLTVNGPVKYAIEKNKLYLIDENDREFKMKIEKKIAIEKTKEPEPAKP